MAQAKWPLASSALHPFQQNRLRERDPAGEPAPSSCSPRISRQGQGERASASRPRGREMASVALRSSGPGNSGPPDPRRPPPERFDGSRRDRPAFAHGGRPGRARWHPGWPPSTPRSGSWWVAARGGHRHPYSAGMSCGGAGVAAISRACTMLARAPGIDGIGEASRRWRMKLAGLFARGGPFERSRGGQHPEQPRGLPATAV